MANKRQNEDFPESLTTAKKSKSGESEFNGTAFKSMLKDPAKALKGLDTFIKIAKKLPSADLYDVVEGYIKISVDCLEIFRLLEGENHSESEMMLIFQSLEMILLRTASDLSHLSMVGSNIVRKTLSTHMKLLLSSLYSNNYRFVRQCLCFLSAMVSQGTEAARGVFSHVNFSRGLSGLARRRDKLGKPDIRMAYIQFVLSFLMSGDNTIIGQIVDTKDFLYEIVSSGLKDDRISIVNLILSTLQTKVIQNKTITKTQKVRLFSPSVLAQIASLYRWNGIVDISTDDEEKGEGGKRIVRELVHNFLLDLCCSRKHGISFPDPSLGTAGRAGNIVLLQFLVGLKQATEDEMVAELVVSVLKNSPDLLTRYFKETQFSFTPRIKSVWQNNVSLLKKIYEAQPEVSKAFEAREMIPLPRLLSMHLVTSLPPVCNKVFFTQGINLPNLVVQHTTLSLLTFILKRAQKNIEHCLDRTVWESSEIYSPAMMDEFVQLYRQALSKILPDMVSIVSKWQSLSKENDDGANIKTTGHKKEDKREAEEHTQQDEPKLILVKALLLQVMCLYQRVVPHLVSQSKFDFSKLLKGIVTDKGMKQEVPPVLQYQIIQLTLLLPASKFSWFRVQENADLPMEKGEKSVFYLLLKMFVNSNGSYLKTSTRMLVLKVLRDSGVFEHTWKELELWLDHLTHLDQSQQETVIRFLDHVLMKVVCNQHVYTEKAASMVQEAAYLQTNLSSQEGDEASIPISHIDDVLDMVDVILEGNEGDVEEIGPPLTEDIILQMFPFSVIVPAVLESRNKLPDSLRDENGVVYEYMSAVLCDILHCQRDPLALCLTLQHYDKELNPTDTSAAPHPPVITFYNYYSQWLPKQSQETLFITEDCTESPSAGGFTALLKAVYSEGPCAFLQDSFKEAVHEALAKLDVSQIPLAVSQVLLYIRTYVLNFNLLQKQSAAEVLSCLMTVLNSLILKLLNSEQARAEPAEQKEEEELFFDTNLIPSQNTDKEQIIRAVLRSVFKHPTVELWFLALELGTFPPHTLNPVHLKQLCVCLSEGTLTLLQSSAVTLRQLHALELISTYLTTTHRAVLKQLQESIKCPKKDSRALRVLLSLHEYIDSYSLKEVVSTLLLLPQECLVTAENELGVYGHAVLELFTDNMSRSGFSTLSHAHLRGLAALLTSCQCVQLEDFLLQVLSQEPGSARLIQTEVLLHCIQRDSPSAQALGVLLLQNCSTHVLSFELWCLESANLSQITSQSTSFLCLLNTYLQRAALDDPSRPKHIQRSVLQALKKALLSELWSAVQEGEARVSTGLHVQVLSNLIRLAASNSDLTQLMNDLPSILNNSDSYESWQLADCISEKLCDSSEELSYWRRSLLTAAFHWLSKVYKEQKDPQTHHEEAMLTRVKSLLIFPENVTASDWNNFVKSGLKYRYCDPGFLGTLNTLLEIMYGAPETSKEFLPLATLHMMITSHSLFLPTMLTTQDDPDSLSKEALVSLLLTLVKKCREVCNTNHFLVLLGAYGASLSTTDQKLLLLLREYEKNNISLKEFQYVLWGPSALEHHKARKSLGPSLWQRPSSEQLLSLLTADRMMNTVMHFPQQRYIIPRESKGLIYSQEGKRSLDLSCLYDPCFLLPLFSFILCPECVVDCQKFVSSHALGVTVAALSSYDPKVRAAAYQILGSFYQHLEGARFQEKRQLLYLLDTVKNGIQKQNQQVPFVHVTYITKVAQQIFKPEEHMYVVVTRFILGTQFLDLKRIPDFFKLFFSCDMEHKMERKWVLSVLEEGVRDKFCYELFEKQGICQTLMGFSSSPLCDQLTQNQILNILLQAAHVNRAAYDLTKEHGVLTWILQLIEKRYVDSKLLSCVIELLHTLWFTNLGDKEGSTDSSSTAAERPQTSGRCLPLQIINEFQSTLLTVIRHLGAGVSAPQLKAFLHTLSSVLTHCGTAVNAHRESGWLTLHPHKLPCSEVLILLQRWGILAHDTSLLSALQALANKHKVKELLGSGREKGQGKYHPVKHNQFQMEKQNDVVDGQREILEQALMEECKPLLRNILIQWEPKQQKAVITDQPDSIDLGDATSRLILKWALKTLAESPYQGNSTLAFLKWMHRNILPRADIVDAFLTDEDARNDILRLYRQTYDHTTGEHRSTVETLQLFSAVMVNFLEARSDSLSDIHQMVIKTCMPSNEDDVAKTETGLKLLSLYIYEIWSGARSPDLLLTHARLVCGGNRKCIKKAKSHILHMCQDILSTVDS
ncbi:nucleolar pre-ribosomal-associated protein 1 isoform X2 [Myxocyprinus asiaticus]|uniref:nucleolar pre-ribosomal-associated protein 1 isoform X2 n=1 Tax=Myxocyprinus asiaticus TaxID=70543 RepID=UPI002221565D|nr:nucleolar pre-ribosomal-associated protein 1 isoform X2 [Myxocyprinus asiaticus]